MMEILLVKNLNLTTRFNPFKVLPILFQTWDRNSVPVIFCTVIYYLSTVDSELLAKTQLGDITGLTKYEFITNIIASDGASENRSANKKITTLTANDDLVNYQVKQDDFKNLGFLMNMQIIFHYPSISNDCVIIFIDSDIPHLIIFNHEYFRNIYFI